MKSDRRAFLGSLASLGALAACNSSSLPSGGLKAVSAASNLLRPRGAGFCVDYPLRLINETKKIKDENIYFLLFGRSAEGAAPFVYLDPTDGEVKDGVYYGKVKSPKPTGGRQTADYNFNLAKISKFKIPYPMYGARWYVSYDKPVLLEVDADGRIREPDSISEKDVNYKTAWDFIEWTRVGPCNNFSIDAFAPNFSQVDGFTIPMQFHIDGHNTKGDVIAVTRGTNPGGYTEIRKKIVANEDFTKLALTNASGRILSPIKGLTAKVFSDSYYQKYINDVWEKYTPGSKTFTKKLTALLDVWGDVEGEVKNDLLVFTQTPNQGAPKLDPIAFKKPTTEQVLFGTIHLACVSGCRGGVGIGQANAVSQLGSGLGPAFNRSTLLKETTISHKVDQQEGGPYCENTKAFYDVGDKGTTNWYAKFIHEQAKENLAYAFSQDDVCGQSSIVHYRVPEKEFTVTLVER